MERPQIWRCSWIAVLALLCAPVAAAELANPKKPVVETSDAAVAPQPRDEPASPGPRLPQTASESLPPAASEKPSPAPPAKTPPASEKPGAPDRQGPEAEAGGKASDRQAPSLPVSALKTDRRVVVFALEQPVASQVAEVLNDVLRTGGRGADSPRLTAKLNSNSIVALGTVEELDEINDILKLLNVPQLGPGDVDLPLATYDVAGGDKGPTAFGLPTAPPPTLKQLAVYRLRYAAASHALAVLSQVFGGDRGNDTLKMQANVVNNSVVALGRVEKIREVVALLKLLDISQPRRVGTAVDPKANAAMPGLGSVRGAPYDSEVDPKTKAALPGPPAIELTEIFSLKHTQAEAALAVIRALYGTERERPSTIAADERTNSIIARGLPESLKEIEALLLRLDTVESARAGAASKETGGSEGPAVAQLPDDPATLDRLATDRLQQYRELERQASRLAADCLNASAGAPDKVPDELFRRLRVKVTEAFEARQELQRLEVAQLHQRLARIDENIVTRQRIKGAIVEYRIGELLLPGLQWTPPGEEAASSAKAAGTRHAAGSAGTSAAGPSPAPLPVWYNVPKAVGPKPKMVVVNFQYAPWPDVLKWLADQMGVGLQLDHTPPGRFNCRNPQSVSVDGVFESLKVVLATKGYLLLREEGRIRVVRAEGSPSHFTRRTR